MLSFTQTENIDTTQLKLHNQKATSNLHIKNLIIEQQPGEALAQLEHQINPQSCLVLTSNPCPDHLQDLLEYQPAALLANGETLEDAMRALQVIAAGGRVISLPENAQSILTVGERAVLRCVVRAQCDKRIAKQLGINDGTVRKRVSEMLDKLQLENRMQLSYYYLGLWSFLDAYRNRIPLRLGEHLWGVMGTNVHSPNGTPEANLETFEPKTPFGHSRAPQAGSSTGGFMIHELNDDETLTVIGGWIPNPRFDNPDLRIGRPSQAPYPAVPLWKRFLDPQPQIPLWQRVMANGQG